MLNIPVASQAADNAAQDMHIQEPAAMQEAPPPWNSASESLPTPQTTANTAASMASNTASASDSSVENWYRNRRKSTVSVEGEMARLQTAAKAGDADAQYRLAMLYRNGDSSAKQIKESLEWQRKAAEAGNVEAQYGLGLLYANGQYVKQDNKKAVDWLQKAAAQGHVNAKLVLASTGNGAESVPAPARPASVQTASGLQKTEPETKAAESLPEPTVAAIAEPEPPMPSVETHTAQATETAGIIPASLQVPATDTPDNNKASDAGTTAELDLTGIEPEVVKQSAEAGDKHAQLMLGTMYEDGLGGLPSDLREAAHWYEQAARQGYTKAQYNLGLLYEDGRGVAQNYERAAYWYEKAAKSGFVEAQNNLGVLYVLGNGVKQDKKKAAKLFSLAAEKGNADAQRNLGMLQGS